MKPSESVPPKGAKAISARKRRAAELIAPFNTEKHFKQATAPAGVTLGEQTPIWLDKIQDAKAQPSAGVVKLTRRIVPHSTNTYCRGLAQSRCVSAPRIR